MKTKLFLLFAAMFVLSPMTFAQQSDDCRRRNMQGTCTDATWHIMLGDKNPENLPIVILQAPELSETQKRNILSYAAGKLTKDFGNNVLFVTDERQIQPSWKGSRHVLTFNYRVQTVAGQLEPVTSGGAVKRSSAKAGLRILDVVINSLPGNGRVANAGKAAAADAAQEIGRAEADKRGLSRLNRDRVYAVTAELLSGDGRALKAFRPETKYFKIREIADSQTGQTDFYLVGEGDSPKQISEMEPIVYLGYTTDAVDNALSEEMFIQLFRQGGSVSKQIRGAETQLKVASAMQNCTKREWDKQKNDWVCKDSVEATTPPPCKTQVRDSSGEWRCAAEQQQPAPTNVPAQTQAAASQAKIVCMNDETPRWVPSKNAWTCLPVSGPVPPPAHAKVEPPAQAAPASQPPPTTTPAPAVVVSGFAEIYYDSARPKMQGENVKRILAYMVNKNYLGWNPSWDFAWGSNADRAWHEVEATAFAANIPGIVQDGRVNASEWQWLSGLPPETFALNQQMQQTEARIKARQKK